MPGGARRFFDAYTHGLTTQELERLFTRDTPEAYRFFARHIDVAQLAKLPWHKRVVSHIRLFFLAFTLKLTPERRAIYGMALLACFFGLFELLIGFRWLLLPHPIFADGTLWMLTAFLLVNLLVLLEVADRLSLKNDLEIAREIQQAMLPRGPFQAEGIDAFGMTRPANTVGGDFYDVIPLGDGRVLITLGDVAGKGSPAALLMALLLAMLRTLVDEQLEPEPLVTRLNAQICRHSPGSRFITFFYGVYTPASGALTYVNAGQNPPLIRRADGSYERLGASGIALGMFEGSTYTSVETRVNPDELLVLYSDGITEAEDPQGQPLEEPGLQAILERHPGESPAQLGTHIIKAVERHAQASRFTDDLTILILRRRALI
jgi:serine phosphatase RsbU (regulator of sigma subunit)